MLPQDRSRAVIRLALMDMENEPLIDYRDRLLGKSWRDLIST